MRKNAYILKCMLIGGLTGSAVGHVLPKAVPELVGIPLTILAVFMVLEASHRAGVLRD
jgi:uncharacterized membrane protein YfcA